MSTTSIYSVFKSTVTCIGELPNGHGSGPAIWDYISLKCAGRKFPIMGDVSWFWPLWKDARLSDNERAVLLSTYDNAIVEIEHLKAFSLACKEVHEKIIQETEWEWNHFANIGILAEQLAEKHDHRSQGLGIGCTSVSDPWEWYKNDKDIWGVYALIGSLKGDK